MAAVAYKKERSTVCIDGITVEDVTVEISLQGQFTAYHYQKRRIIESGAIHMEKPRAGVFAVHPPQGSSRRGRMSHVDIPLLPRQNLNSARNAHLGYTVTMLFTTQKEANTFASSISAIMQECQSGGFGG